MVIEGVAGELPAAGENVVAAGALRRDTQTAAGRHQHLLLTAQIVIRRRQGEGKVQIPHVVVYRPAAGEPAYHPDSMLLYIGGVDLADGILVFPHNDGVVVLPEHAVCMGPVQPVKDILLQRQVESGIMAATLQIIHHAAYPS